MAIHYLISLLSKSLQLPRCYPARTVTHGVESLALPQPGKGIKSISQVFEAYYPKRNMTAQMGAQDHQAGEPLEHRFQQTLASRGLQASHCNSTRQLQPCKKLSSPSSPLPACSSTLTPRLVPVLHTCLQPRALGTCRSIGIRPRQTGLLPVSDKSHFSSPDWSSPSEC